MNEILKMTCDIEADPLNSLEFFWSTNGSSSDLTWSRSVNVINNTVARSHGMFQAKTKSDYGIVFCWAKNSIGQTQSHEERCVFNVVPSGKLINLSIICFMLFFIDSIPFHCTVYPAYK